MHGQEATVEQLDDSGPQEAAAKGVRQEAASGSQTPHPSSGEPYTRPTPTKEERGGQLGTCS